MQEAGEGVQMEGESIYLDAVQEAPIFVTKGDVCETGHSS